MRKKTAIGSSGNSTFFVLLAVVIIGAFFLAGGLGLGNSLSPTSGPTDTQPIITGADSARDSLQLQTLKFKQCSSQLTMDLLLDRSGSMRSLTSTGGTKIDNLKSAVNTLTKNMSDDSIIGIQSFSSTPANNSCASTPSAYNLSNDVPISYYKDTKKTITAKVNALTPNGCTPTSESLTFAYDQIKSAQVKFPNRKFNLVFITDGHPEPSTEDPRLFDPNPVEQLKNAGVEIYTIGVYGVRESEDSVLTGLLKYTASRIDNYYVSTTGSDLSNLLATIAQKICNAE